MTAAEGGHEAGFTLLETIVAFVILAISLALGVETISQGVKTFSRSDDLEEASLILQGLAAGPLRNIEEAGEISGSTGTAGGDRAVWRLTAAAVPDSHVKPLFVVSVTIWPRARNGPVFTYHTFATRKPQR